VKAERHVRRVAKKDKKEQFATALKQHSQAFARKGAKVTQL